MRPAPAPRTGEIAAGGSKLHGWLYAVGPASLALLLIMRHFQLVAQAPVWAYALVLLSAPVVSKLLERWSDAETGSWRLHVRSFCNMLSVTATIYLSGWGPALGMAYVFSAQIDIDQIGSAAWRPLAGWSFFGCTVGQLLIFLEVAPSILAQSHAQTVGFLGAVVFGIAIVKAGQTQEVLEVRAVEERVARDALELSEAQHRAVVENAADGIVTMNMNAIVVAFNAAAEKMFCTTSEEMVGESIAVLMVPELRDGVGDWFKSYALEGENAVLRKGLEVEVMRRDGTRFPVLISTSVIDVEGSVPLISAHVRDLSDQKRFEEELSFQASHDSLTGLPNRVLFNECLEQALARVRRTQQMLSVLFVDLNRFKAVNDGLGHIAGDRLLIEAATRIGGVVREIDTVARIGGDEFVVLLENGEHLRDATDVAQRIVESISTPFNLGDKDASVSASIGIAVTWDGSQSVDEIMRNADTAMYRAKESGSGCFELFDEAMQHWVTDRLSTEQALRQALHCKEFVLHYQPVVDTDSGDIESFEALIRWDRPGHGLVPPNCFLPIAEEIGLMPEIGAWVLREACVQAASWAQQWPDRRLGLAVNVSSRQILGGACVDVVMDALATSGLDATLLTLEITESSLIDDAINAAIFLRALREVGVNLALDDFGTGYSSLTYLRTFPINIIKVDQSFVRTLGSDHDDTAIVAGVIALARNLNVRVVAEGVETHEQLATLIMLRCDYLQGYLLSRPVPADAVASLLEGPVLGYHAPDVATAA